MPSRRLNSGPPKLAEKPILGNPRLATATSATRSLMELPQARRVRPNMASENPSATPKTFSRATTSLARA